MALENMQLTCERSMLDCTEETREMEFFVRGVIGGQTDGDVDVNILTFNGGSTGRGRRRGPHNVGL